MRAIRFGLFEAATKRMCVDLRLFNGVCDVFFDCCDEFWRIVFDFIVCVGVFIECFVFFC